MLLLALPLRILLEMADNESMDATLERAKNYFVLAGPHQGGRLGQLSADYLKSAAKLWLFVFVDPGLERLPAIVVAGILRALAGCWKQDAKIFFAEIAAQLSGTSTSTSMYVQQDQNELQNLLPFMSQNASITINMGAKTSGGSSTTELATAAAAGAVAIAALYRR